MCVCVPFGDFKCDNKNSNFNVKHLYMLQMYGVISVMYWQIQLCNSVFIQLNSI